MNNNNKNERRNPLAEYLTSINKQPEATEEIITEVIESNPPSNFSGIGSMVFAELLTYSPYEKVGGYSIETKEFIEEIQVTTNSFQVTAKTLIDNLLRKTIPDNCISFLTGFPGVGKTTFINWLIYFINQKQECEQSTMKPLVLTEEKNKQLLAYYINCSFTGSSERDGLKTIVSNEIANNFNDYKKTIEFLISHKYMEQFDRVDVVFFKELLDKNKNSPDRNQIKQLIDNQPLYKDSLILLLLLHKWIDTKEKNNEATTIFFIDNLDALNSIYLYDDDDNFWKDLISAYSKFRAVVIGTGGNANKLKLIFSLRNYNHSLILSRFDGHHYDHYKLYMSQQPYNLISTDLNQILVKRKTYAVTKNLMINKDLLSVVEIILSEDTLYREKVYLPLFNYDIRSLNQHIARLTGEMPLDFSFSKSKEIYDQLFAHYSPQNENKHPFRNGARGIVLHSLIKALFNSNEKYPIEPITYEENSTHDTAPFCSECRMLMTVIYNLSYKTKLRNDLSDIEQKQPATFSLADLIKSLRIYPNGNKQVISTDKILHWLVKFNGTNNESHIHLIDMSGLTKDSVKNADGSSHPQIHYNTMTENELIRKINLTPKFRLHDRASGLTKIKIKINPSAVIYLRYLVCHFEFFAAYKYWQNDKFTKSFKPLYLATDLKKDQNSYKYEFQNLLEDVFSLVKQKKHKNDNFLMQRMFNRDFIPNTNSFINSDFSFRILKERESDRRLFESGMLYSSRVITTHLRYIASFRSYLNTTGNIKEVIKNNNTQYQSLSLNEINLFIFNIEKKYIDLYLENNSSAKSEILDTQILRAIEEYKKIVENRINAINISKDPAVLVENEEISLDLDESDEIHLTGES